MTNSKRRVKAVKDETEIIRFAKSTEDAKSLARDPRLALLAVSVHSQQAAGFKNYIDLREAQCPNCKSSGFNSGWGYWRFVCGAEILSDGAVSEPCPITPLSPTKGKRK